MAEPEVEAAWRAELKRIGEKQAGDTLDSSTSNKQVPLHWLGDEVEARRLRQEHAHHYLRWTFMAAIGANIAKLPELLGKTECKRAQLTLILSRAGLER